jgi:hypothetical protein
MTPNDQTARGAAKAVASPGRKQQSSSPGGEPAPGKPFIAFTIDTATGRLVSAEAVDATGARQTVSEEERAFLTRAGGPLTIEGLIEEAFEAGVDCAFGDPDGDPDAAEADSEDTLKRALLRSLIEHSRARRLTQREILGPAILRTLMAQAIEPGEPNGSASH